MLGIRIYLVFYKKLLKLVLPNVELATNIKLKDNKYKVKEIINLRKHRR